MSTEQKEILKMTKMQKLQKQYNKIHERLGYLRDARHIEAANDALDEIVEQMEKLMKKN